MGVLLKLSLRNLLRQKKRNILLGLGIAFGMMIIVIANSFSHGMVDVLIEDVVTYAFGHIVVDSRIGSSGYHMIRDKRRIEWLIKNTIKPEDLRSLNENPEIICRAVGNGAAGNIAITTIPMNGAGESAKVFNNLFTLVAGSYHDYFSKRIEYPVIISQSKAKSLNVKVHDVIRARVSMVTGQIQEAKLTVIAIAKVNNSFMNIALFMDGQRVKKLLGYKPWEASGLTIILREPQKNANQYAELLQRKLKPGIISIEGKLESEPCRILAFQNNASAQASLVKMIRITQGDRERSFGKKGVLLSNDLAQVLNVKPGDELTYRYTTKYRGNYEEKFKINAIYDSGTKLGHAVMLVNEERIHDTFDRFLPAQSQSADIAADDPLVKTLATEWKLLKRSANSDELEKKNRQERRIKTDQAKMDVITMYEGASDVLQLEDVMNLITIIAVMVLFFIISIGVINTLRMTIKERTREIGTIRAVGMQKRDVRNMFILETLQLTAFSCLAGLVLGIIIILITGAINFDINNSLSMILRGKHLYFKINPLGLISNFMLIMLFAGVTAYFPASRAAKLSAVEALRHYE